jgi:hypothetical protein
MTLLSVQILSEIRTLVKSRIFQGSALLTRRAPETLDGGHIAIHDWAKQSRINRKRIRRRHD